MHLLFADDLTIGVPTPAALRAVNTAMERWDEWTKMVAKADKSIIMHTMLPAAWAEEIRGLRLHGHPFKLQGVYEPVRFLGPHYSQQQGTAPHAATVCSAVAARAAEAKAHRLRYDAPYPNYRSFVDSVIGNVALSSQQLAMHTPPQIQAITTASARAYCEGLGLNSATHLLLVTPIRLGGAGFPDPSARLIFQAIKFITTQLAKRSEDGQLLRLAFKYAVRAWAVASTMAHLAPGGSALVGDWSHLRLPAGNPQVQALTYMHMMAVTCGVPPDVFNFIARR